MKKVHIYTDGSSRGNPGPGGYGTILVYGDHEREMSGGFELTTNNRMELMAAIVGLETLTKKCAVIVTSDSKYVINALNEGWLAGWKNNGWVKKNRERVKNADLWKRVDALNESHDVEWIWVKGQAGHEHNERCDILATEAAQSRGLTADEGYLAEQEGDQELF